MRACVRAPSPSPLPLSAAPSSRRRDLGRLPDTERGVGHAARPQWSLYIFWRVEADRANEAVIRALSSVVVVDVSVDVCMRP
jgi:hypothetical protein